MTYVTTRPVKIHGRSGALTEIASGQPLPVDTPPRVIKILQAQRAIAEASAAAAAPATPAAPVAPASTSTPSAAADAGTGDDKGATAAAKR